MSAMSFLASVGLITVAALNPVPLRADAHAASVQSTSASRVCWYWSEAIKDPATGDVVEIRYYMMCDDGAMGVIIRNVA